VAASLQAPTLFTIAEDLRKMEVHTSVAESDVGQLEVGMQARFTVDAFADAAFTGEVKQVRYEAQTVQNVVTYDAVVSVDNAQLKLRPGMTANVTFVVATRRDVLRIPTAALRFRPPEALRPAGAGERPPGAGERPAHAKGHAKGRAKGHAKGHAKGRAKGHAKGRPGGSEGGRPGRSGRFKRFKGGRPGGGRPARLIWVLRAGAPAPVRIVTGISDGSLSEVVRGELREGAPVIIGLDDASGEERKGSRRRGRRRPRLF
jgi:HlyD family secretion protein